MATKTNWKAILAVYLIGVAAAAQVGRIAPAANSLREDMAMGLTTYGWMVSLITFASAVLGSEVTKRQGRNYSHPEDTDC